MSDLETGALEGPQGDDSLEPLSLSLSLSDDNDGEPSVFSAPVALFEKRKEEAQSLVPTRESHLLAGPGTRRLLASNRNTICLYVTLSVFIIVFLFFGFYFANLASNSRSNTAFRTLATLLFVSSGLSAVVLAISLAKSKRGYVSMDDATGDLEIFQPSDYLGICGGVVSSYHYTELTRDPFLDVTPHDARATVSPKYVIVFPFKNETVIFSLQSSSQSYQDFDLMGPPESIKAEVGIILDWLRSMERRCRPECKKTILN